MNGDTVTNDIKTIELLNSYFSTVFTQENIDGTSTPKLVFRVNNNEVQ